MSTVVPIEVDLLSRIDTEALWQPFLERVNAMLNSCASRKQYYVGLTGFRSREEQEALYAIGRTTGKIGRVVTQVRGGQSRHQHYCAIDFGYDLNREKPGLQYGTEDEQYRCLAEEARRVGLEAGFYWGDEGRTGFRDTPHIEAPVRQWGIKTADLEAAYQHGYVSRSSGLRVVGRWAVIALLDARSRW